MARRSDHSREDLERLSIDTARKIIIEDGQKALTARKLAEEIGYTPGTLYNVFGSMDGVVFKVNYETLEALETELLQSVQSNMNEPIEIKIKEMAKAYIDFSYKNKNLWLLIFDYTSPQGQRAPQWFKDKIENLFSGLENILEGNSVFKSDKEKKMAARTLWSSVHGICYMAQTDKIGLISGESPYKLAEFMIENFLNGLKT